MASKENRRITDMGTLKALAHPLRMKLYRGLIVARVATASQLAEQVEHGVIEEAPAQSADGRERWWQPASDGVSIHDEDFRGAPEKAAVYTAASRLFSEQRTDLYRRYLDERAHWTPEWNRAAESSESAMRLTAGELSELVADMQALLKAYTERGRAAEEAGDTEGRENVAVHTYAFPFRV
jgi:hypothetical protein